MTHVILAEPEILFDIRSRFSVMASKRLSQRCSKYLDDVISESVLATVWWSTGTEVVKRKL